MSTARSVKPRRAVVDFENRGGSGSFYLRKRIFGRVHFLTSVVANWTPVRIVENLGVLRSRRPLSQRLSTMAWRAQGMTGSNAMPLGSKRRLGADSTGPEADGGFAAPAISNGGGEISALKRGRSPVRGEYLRLTVLY